MSIPDAAAFLGVSEETARKLIRGIKDEIGPGRRYNEFVLIGHGKTLRVSAAAFADYSKYSDALQDASLRSTLKPFDILAVERAMGITPATVAAIEPDALAAACARALLQMLGQIGAAAL
jgi:hypothetical protein